MAPSTSQTVPEAAWPSKMIAAPQLDHVLAQISDFLKKIGYDKTVKALAKEAEKNDLAGAIDAISAISGPLSTSLGDLLVDAFLNWDENADDERSAEDESSASSSDEEEDSSSSEEEDSDSDDEEQVSEMQVDTVEAKDSSDESESEDEESEEEVAEPAKTSIKRKRDESDSESSEESESESGDASESSDEEDSESDDSNSDAPPAKKARIQSDSNDSESEQSDDDSESSESESEDSDDESDESSETSEDDSSDEESDAVEAAPPKNKRISPGDSQSSSAASSVTLTADEVNDNGAMHPSRAGRMNNSKQQPATTKGSNVPFSRIPKDTKVDPRFGSNAYVSYDYADRAHNDLIVTKGKGFTKEKNKKKRGSYRGGMIDTAPKGIKFDD